LGKAPRVTAEAEAREAAIVHGTGCRVFGACRNAGASCLANSASLSAATQPLVILHSHSVWGCKPKLKLGLTDHRRKRQTHDDVAHDMVAGSLPTTAAAVLLLLAVALVSPPPVAPSPLRGSGVAGAGAADPEAEATYMLYPGESFYALPKVRPPRDSCPSVTSHTTLQSHPPTPLSPPTCCRARSCIALHRRCLSVIGSFKKFLNGAHKVASCR
jgi:hypothetical protein